MVLASGMTRQDPNPAGILTQMVILPTHIQYLKWQDYIKAEKIFIALIAKATFPKFSHYYLLIPCGYVQESCCINAKKHRNAGWRRSSGGHPAWPLPGSRPVPALDQVSLWLCLKNAAEVDAASLWNCPLPCFHWLVYKMVEYACNLLVNSYVTYVYFKIKCAALLLY